MVGATALDSTITGVVVFLAVNLRKEYWPWGWMRVAQGSMAIKNTDGLVFSKVMGSGQGGGFGIRPSPSHQGLICVFKDLGSAQAFCEGPIFKSYQAKSHEFCWGMYRILASRGSWDSWVWAPEPSPMAHPNDTIAVLTRASIHANKTIAFWRHAPAAQADMNKADGCLFAMGLGEAPFVRQCTFSVWTGAAAVDAYARHGAHQKAIQAAYKHAFFSESMFVRLRVLSLQGLWAGKLLDIRSEQPAVFVT